ncbi:cytochrome P450 [Apiospora kogelbergensis]|uniref:cytochrome P450 n=1 Tax=Apiospora kogelbergensis TaxID=1337665 RepID=UPI00312D9B6A
MVSSDAQIKELVEAPETVLSLHAVAKDLFKPKYTMNDFEVHDQMAANGSMHFRVLRTLLTASLPRIMPELRQVSHVALQRELAKGSIGSQGCNYLAPSREDGWTKLHLFDTAKRLVSAVNSHIFFGEELTNDADFRDAALAYPQDVFVTGEILQFTPSLFARRGKAMKTLLRYLVPVVDKRIKSRDLDIPPSEKPRDCIQWVIDSSPTKERWTTKKTVQEILALWFGSVHQLSMSFVYAMFDLVDNPDYIQLLREEMAAASPAASGGGGDWLASLDGLRLLDSFLRESARLHPSDSISVRRMALSDYRLGDGTLIPRGAWACVPQRAIQRDPALYPNPDAFDGHRHLGSAESPPALLTDPSPKFPLWGLGKRTCPGRFYAASVLKMMVGSMLQDYDFAVKAPQGKRVFTWRSAIVPRSDVVIEIRPL